MGSPGSIEIFNINPSPDAKQQREPALKWSPEGSKSVAVAWSYLDKNIVSGHEDGAVALFDASTGKEINKQPAHDGLVTDLQMSPDGTWFLTSSKDKTAKVSIRAGVGCMMPILIICPASRRRHASPD